MKVSTKKLLALLLTVAMLLGLMVGCGGGSEKPVTNDPENQGGEDANVEVEDTRPAMEPQYGGHLNVAASKVLHGIDPVTKAQIWYYMYETAVFENPLTRDAENNICPGVCDYEMSEDGMSITLKVRDGLTFHDGSLVEIEDVKASIERAIVRGNSVKEFLGPAIGSMEIVDDKLVIHWSARNQIEGGLSRLAAYQTWLAVMPKEICEKYPTSDIEDVAEIIGTGPYRMTDWEYQNFVTLTKYEDYVPLESDRTGFAGPKYGYLDSITFWQNTDYSSVVMGMLAGQYDVTDCMEEEYIEMARDAGIIQSHYATSQYCGLWYFNNMGYDNLCSKYPPLRKAIIAAIDMQEYATITSDNAMTIEGKGPVLDPEYHTNWYNETDWYGPTNQEAVNKYLDEARAMGYDDEPIQLVMDSMTEAITIMTGYFDNAGIHYEINFMDPAAVGEFLLDPKNNWDMQTDMEYGSFLPSTLCEENLTYFYASEERDRLLAELLELESGTEEYKAKWQELHKQIVDDCSIIHTGFYRVDWMHRETLHPDYEGDQAYFFNTWWEDPENHTK